VKPGAQAVADEAWQMLSGFIQAAQMIPQAQRAAEGSLPLTVIGGFLGAGKTTLVNRLLSGDHGLRIAVLVNDFGRINIDAALIRSRTEDTISLANGCACCTIAGDLTKTLIGLAARKDPPEAIVLEASGLADPVGIAQVALANPALRLDGILAVVDAEAALRWAADPACAAPFAAPTDVVLGIGSARELPLRFAVPSGHAAAFRSWSGSIDSPLDGARVREMLGGLPAATLRAKGLLWLSEDQRHRTVFQRVGQRFSYTAEDWGRDTPVSSLVVIGPAESIDPAALSIHFEACRVVQPVGMLGSGP